MGLKLLDILNESNGIVPFPFKTKKTIVIMNDNGEKISVNCEIPLTDEEHSQGLLHRTELCKDCGVLFDSNGSYHMVGMEFPIEMIFIDGDEIIDIIKAKPGDNNIRPKRKYTKNLEVNDGFCVENGVSVGCKVVE